ncbi:MAG: C/D box methylation guide ribonucleoprotein complex aNOP56 subunit [Thermoprotei archaeon]|nr:MAG: C/D box methylation guide ribonucleoprotein complex aNOP56 subunit [Thermoprotei archaeon]
MPSRAYLVESPLGLLALAEDGSIISVKEFPRDVEALAGKLMAVERGELIPELRELVEDLIRKNITEVVFESEELARNVSREFAQLKVVHELPSRGGQLFRSNIRAYVEKMGLSWEEYRALLYDVSVLVTKKKVREAAEKRDLFVAQAISAIDELDRTINLFASRLREWYSLHFPELNEIVRDHRDFVRMVYELGSRDNFTEERLKELGVPPPRARKIERSARESMGATMTDFDMEAIKHIASLLLQLYDARKNLEVYVDEAMKEVAPNIRGLVGPLLGARLIALAGGLQKLATLPASTIQVLGAEKALFRALRTGGKPPKHGVIFQYPAIFRSPRWQRGKIARALAAKLAIAARIDAFSGEYKADEIKEELQKRIEEIKKLYPRPPKRVEKPPRRRKRRR